MQNTPVKLLDAVALLNDQPARGLVGGQVGTVVEVHAPGVFEVEFLDGEGRTVALAEFPREQLLVLKHEAPVARKSALEKSRSHRREERAVVSAARETGPPPHVGSYECR